MRIAVPRADGRLAQHFGHCPEFVFFDVDPESKTVLGKEVVAAPEHQPGLLPPWLASHNTQLIIAGGMEDGRCPFLIPTGFKFFSARRRTRPTISSKPSCPGI